MSVVDGSRDDPDGLDDLEQALLAEDPEFVRRLRARSAALPVAGAGQPAPVDRASVLVAVWSVTGALVLLSLAAGSLVGAAGTCVLALVLHLRTCRGPRVPGAAAPPARRSRPAR